MNYFGNASAENDPTLPLSDRWMRPSPDMGIADHRDPRRPRLPLAPRPRLGARLRNGHLTMATSNPTIPKAGATASAATRSSSSTGPNVDWTNGAALGAWAWGLSRAMDYLATVPSETPVAWRCSAIPATTRRLSGQTAGRSLPPRDLERQRRGWCVISRRNFGENIAYSIAHASWRYCDQFRDYIDRPHDLPFDQHMLLVPVTPRPLYVASATEDGLADPKGEFLSAVHVGPVYRLFGRDGLDTTAWPTPDHPVGQTVGYPLRTGSHDIATYDWEQFLNFSDRHFSRAR